MSSVLIAAALVASSACGSIEPVVVASYTDLGGGLTGWTVGIDFTADGLQRSAYFDLAFHSTHIIQRQGLGADVNEVAQALIAATLDPNYDPALDSYFLAGPDTTWSTYVPPFYGVAPPTGAPGSDLFVASFATPPSSPVSGLSPILYLVTDRPDGRVDYSGVIARNSVDYFVSGAFEIPEPTSIGLLGLGAGLLCLMLCRARR